MLRSLEMKSPMAHSSDDNEVLPSSTQLRHEALARLDAVHAAKVVALALEVHADRVEEARELVVDLLISERRNIDLLSSVATDSMRLPTFISLLALPSRSKLLSLFMDSAKGCKHQLIACDMLKIVSVSLLAKQHVLMYRSFDGFKEKEADAKNTQIGSNLICTASLSSPSSTN